MKHKAFLSFSTEDKPLVDRFREQLENEVDDLELLDYTMKESADIGWKTKCEEILRDCAITICLIGHNTHKSEPVEWELRKSIELGKAIIAVYLEDTAVQLPKTLRDYDIRPVNSDLNEVMDKLRDFAK